MKAPFKATWGSHRDAYRNVRAFAMRFLCFGLCGVFLTSWRRIGQTYAKSFICFSKKYQSIVVRKRPSRPLGGHIDMRIAF